MKKDVSVAEVKYTIKLPPVTKKNSQQILTNRATGRQFIMPSTNSMSVRRCGS